LILEALKYQLQGFMHVNVIGLEVEIPTFLASNIAFTFPNGKQRGEANVNATSQCIEVVFHYLFRVQKVNQACRGSVGEKGIQERLHPTSGDYVRLESPLKLFLEKLPAWLRAVFHVDFRIATPDPSCLDQAPGSRRVQTAGLIYQVYDRGRPKRPVSAQEKGVSV